MKNLNRIRPLGAYKIKKYKYANKAATQEEVFQNAMKWVYICGQCVGLNPVAGVSETDASKMRFSVFTWKYMYCLAIGVLQAFTMLINAYYWITISRSMESLGNACFHLITFVNILLYLHSGTKWPGLMRELAKSSLDNYIDLSVIMKCRVTFIAILILGSVEHLSFLLMKFKGIGDCLSIFDTYEELSRRTFTLYYDMGLLDKHLIIGVLLQIKAIITTINWNFPDIYIMCISIYLRSIFIQINNKIIAASKKSYVSPDYWQSLREDYSKASRLVHSFDDVISGIVFASFANNLLFICLQIYYIFTNGLIHWEHINNILCPNYVMGFRYDSVYLVFSAVYLFARSLAMALLVAAVNSASLMPTDALYNVPASSYCPEVAGTIVKYEIILLQVGGDKIDSKI